MDAHWEKLEEHKIKIKTNPSFYFQIKLPMADYHLVFTDCYSCIILSSFDW